jgi:hypothetical protein
MLHVSQAAVDLIVACEVSSKAYYEKKYRRPEWPGGASGVTVCIGYDLGYANAAKVRRDFAGKVPQQMIDAMVECCGVTGTAARGLLPRVKNRIEIGWAVAIDVFMNVDLPQWTRTVCDRIPEAAKLAPDCLGAIVSVAYNRGASFDKAGDRYREMRDIKLHIKTARLGLPDDDIRAMKRLWPSVRGLRERRDKEAALWNKGLRAPAVVPAAPPIVNEKPPPLVEPPKPGAPEGGTAGGGGLATAEGARQAAESGLDPLTIALLVVAGIVITIGIVLYIRHKRTQPVLARAKG